MVTGCRIETAREERSSVRAAARSPSGHLPLAAILLLSGLSLAASSQEPHGRQPASVVQLSPPLRAVLVEEMRQNEADLQKIVTASAHADWPAIEAAADRIRGAFILEQKLTEQQRRELEQALPEGFVELDARFHRVAESLAIAARHHDSDLVTFYAYKLSDACVACHTRYAPNRFPGFVPPPAGAHPAR